ncbi:hypothetical protein ACLMJK_001843 [Lecanora helva]
MVDSRAMKPTEDRILQTIAVKRRANGEIKSAEGTELPSPSSPVSSEKYGHSRKSSKTSRSSQISELSAELKTRLSYAMVKVQNGWQSQNINDLERMTSHPGSPSSAASEGRRHYRFPASENSSAGFGQHMQASVNASKTTKGGSQSPHKALQYAANGSYYPEWESMHSQSPRAGMAYETFWRNHEENTAHKTFALQSPRNEGPALAPPVEFSPPKSKLQDIVNRQPPVSNVNVLSKPRPLLVPKTPSPKKPPNLRTPSQQAAVEKDAVESLLFMSSPNNPGYLPRGGLLGNPQKSDSVTQMSPNPRPKEFPRSSSRGEPRLRSSLPHPRQSISRRQSSGDQMDKMLDEMPDTSSSDEEQHEFPPAGLSRFAR